MHRSGSFRYTFALLACLTILGITRAQTPDLYDTSVVRDIKLTFHQTNWWSQMVQNKYSKIDIKADMVVDNITYKDVGVRFRGNTSYSYNPTSEKKPFNIMTDAFVPGQRLYGYKNLNLMNSYKDATFVREVIAYEFMRRYLPALKANFVRLFLNNTCWGIYINVQQPNKGYVDDWWRNDDGNLYRADSEKRNTRPTLTYLGTNLSSYQYQYSIEVQNANPWGDLRDFTYVLDQTPVSQLPTALPKTLNIDNALWYLALQNILSNTDSYLDCGNDYLVYHDMYHDRFMVMPWDLNTTFGGYDYGRLGSYGIKTLSPYYTGRSSLRRPLITQLLAVPKWKQRYLAHYRTILAEFFDWKVLGPLVVKYQKLIENAVKADTKKLYSTQSFIDNAIKDVIVTDRYGSYTIPGLKSFVDTKRNYLLNHGDINKPTPTITNMTFTPTHPLDTNSVWVTAKITGTVGIGKATLYFRNTGAFTERPMFDDGLHRDGLANDGVYGAKIRSQAGGTQVQFYLSATSVNSSGGAMTFAPRRATFAPYTYFVGLSKPLGNIIINEFVAKNKTGIKDEKSEFEDWIELKNRGTTPVVVSGMGLSDDRTKPAKWKIPAGWTIQPGKTLLIWADEDSIDGPLHANFKLGGSGEEILLYDKDGKTLVDWIPFGPQKDDVSTGRMEVDPTIWATFPSPTPLGINHPLPGQHLAYANLDPTAITPLSLIGNGTPAAGGTLSLAIGKAPASTPGCLIAGIKPDHYDLGGFGVLLVNPAVILLFPLTTDLAGSSILNLSIPNTVALKGQSLYFQAIVLSATQGGFSNGMVSRINTP